MIVNEKVLKLLEALLHATSQGRLHWEEGESPKSVRLETSQATVDIEEEYPETTSSDYCITLRDQAGKAIEVEFVNSPDGGQYQTVAKLYDLARKSASRVDEIIDKVIAEVTSTKR